MSKVLSGQQRWQLSEARRLEMEHNDKQPAKFACALCKWQFEGTVAKGRVKALAHREKKHPETFNIKRPRRSVRSLSSFRYRSMDEESIQEIQVERRKRAFLNGVEIVD